MFDDSLLQNLIPNLGHYDCLLSILHLKKKHFWGEILHGFCHIEDTIPEHLAKFHIWTTRKQALSALGFWPAVGISELHCFSQVVLWFFSSHLETFLSIVHLQYFGLDKTLKGFACSSGLLAFKNTYFVSLSLLWPIT